MLTVADRVVKQWADLVDEELARLTAIVAEGAGIPDIEAYRRSTGEIAGLKRAVDLCVAAEQTIKGK